VVEVRERKRERERERGVARTYSADAPGCPGPGARMAPGRAHEHGCPFDHIGTQSMILGYPAASLWQQEAALQLVLHFLFRGTLLKTLGFRA